MKARAWTIMILAGALAVAAFAQEDPNQAYIKAMTAQVPAQKAQMLKDFLNKYSGQGVQYENYALANLAMLAYPGKSPQETIEAGEKALSLGGLDDITKYQLLLTVAGVYTQTGQNLEKAKSYAMKSVEIARANRSSDGDEASRAQWNKMIGAGLYVHAQASEKAKDFKSAVDSYIQSYNILKNKQILADLNKMGKQLMDGKHYAEAEKLYRTLYASAKDAATGTLLARSLYYSGKTSEALAVYKEIYARKKSGETAYNIGILLAKDAKTDSSVAPEAIRYLLEAAFLSQSRSKQAMSLAENLFFTANKDIKWNELVTQITDVNKKLEELTKAYNDKFGDKEEESLSASDKKEMKRILDDIEAEKKKLAPLKAKQQQVIDQFNKLLADTKARLGIR
ncbi:MAG: hypothetical protein JW747_03420 [Candidatus Aminicenantes bacterium]|nr:hypothetical protein [Candidatus Aminicenantes bacterium]